MHEILTKLSHALANESDVVFAYLYGSVTKERSGRLSDVNVAVFLAANDSSQQRLQLRSKISQVLQRNDVEVVPLQDAPLDRAFEILKHGRLIGNHLIAELSLPLPYNNDGIVSILARKNLVSPALAKRLAGLGGFRNILVRDYLFLDPERIFREHLGRLDDLRDFAAEIVKFLDEAEKDEP